MMTRREFLAATAAAALGAAPAGARDYPPIGEFVEVDGLRLHYVDQGSGPPVVLIHGASGNLRDMTFSLTGRLAQAGYRAVAFDRPGLGYSDRAPTRGWDPMVQARLLLQAARKLVMDPPVVVGHSWGGAVATAWALEAPDFCRGVLSIAGATYPWGTGVGTFYHAAASPILSGPTRGIASLLIDEDDPEGVLQRIFGPNPVPEGYAEYIGVPLALRDPQFRHNAQDLVHLDDLLQEQAPMYPGLEMPVEAIHGAADRTVDATIHSVALIDAVPNGNLTLLPGIGHMLHHVAEDAVVEAIARLAGVDEAG
jgi:pimeloyl-ACP methyl ester carboxylesterase